MENDAIYQNTLQEYRAEMESGFSENVKGNNVSAANHYRNAAVLLSDLIQDTQDQARLLNMKSIFKKLIKQADELDPLKDSQGNLIPKTRIQSSSNIPASNPTVSNSNDVKRNTNNFETPDYSSSYSNGQLSKDQIFTQEEQESEFFGLVEILDQIPVKEALGNLDKLIGLKTVKKEVKEAVCLAKAEARRRQLNFGKADLSFHAAFVGSPGTGKTTVAKLLGQIYYSAGILKRPVYVPIDHEVLESEFVGKSAKNVDKLVNLALGGMLFIDEAYGLTPGDGSGSQEVKKVVTKLIACLENNRDNLFVVFGGYEKEMKEFIKSNAGFQSRLRTTFHFEDYNKDELFEILKKFLNDNHLYLAPDAVKPAKYIIDKLLEKKENDPDYNFGNARTMRNLYMDFYKQLSVRTLDIEFKTDGSIDDIMSRITKEDVINTMESPEYGFHYDGGIGLDDFSSNDLMDDETNENTSDLTKDDEEVNNDTQEPEIISEGLLNAETRRDMITKFIKDVKETGLDVEIKEDINLHDLVNITDGLDRDTLDKLLDIVADIYMKRSFSDPSHIKYLCNQDFIDAASEIVKDND